MTKPTGRTKRNMRGNSAGGDRHYYMRAGFWQNPVNQFWESAHYSEQTKQQFRTIYGIVK